MRCFQTFYSLCFTLLPLTFIIDGNSQPLNDSNLPIVIITTDGNAPIPDQPRILANMKIIYRGQGARNSVSDQNDPAALNYNGRIEIEIRGSSSQSLPKKQYGLTTLQADNVSNNNVALLGMPKENDWVLNGLAFDASLLRDYLSYALSTSIGQYAPRTRYCEVIINGDYKGLYLLQEKIKVDDNRVNIAKIEPTDNVVPNLSGGYITKADKVTSEDPSAWRMPTYLGSNTDFIHESPKPSAITTQQHAYIQSVFNSLASRAGNPSITNGFPSVIDVPSFIDFMLVNELSANVDAYQFSTFFHKDRNGKLRAGPLWDLNLTYGNDLTFWGLNRSFTNTWQFDNGDNIGPRFWKDLFSNSTYRCYLSKRWNELSQPGEPLNGASINQLIDETVSYISEAAVRESVRWGTIGDHSSHITSMKNWLSERSAWMTTNLGSYAACHAVTVPSLVISRIHYHPPVSSGFPDSGSQEFIEITNTSSAPVDLTGVYFGGTGLPYQFPVGSSLPAGGVIQLANDYSTFVSRYGYAPFDEFTRNLDNDGQSITLIDAYGNTIDQVSYDDKAPWPDADGNGLYLKLIDLSFDNSQASSWESSDEPITSTEVIVGVDDELSRPTVTPNPSTGIIRVQSARPIRTVSVLDVNGKTLSVLYPDEYMIHLDLTPFPVGVYMLRVSDGEMNHFRVIRH